MRNEEEYTLDKTGIGYESMFFGKSTLNYKRNFD